jgi:phosphatidylglycerophosphate synthase
MNSDSSAAPVAIDQRIAKWAARPLARLSVHPNVVTGSSIIVGLSAGWLLAQGDWLIHVGAAIFAVAVWMDHLDGEVARQTGRTSTFGHYFDHAAAMTNYVAGFVGAGIGLGKGPLGAWGLILGIVAGASVAAIMTVRLYIEISDGHDSVRQGVHCGFEIEDTLYVLAPVTWFGVLKYFIIAAGVGAPIFLLCVSWQALGAYRRSRSTDAGQ